MIFKDVGCLVSSEIRIAVGALAYTTAVTLDFTKGSVTPIAGLMAAHFIVGLFVGAKKERSFSFVMANLAAEMFTLLFLAFGLFVLMLAGLWFTTRREIHPPDTMRDMRFFQNDLLLSMVDPVVDRRVRLVRTGDLGIS